MRIITLAWGHLQVRVAIEHAVGSTASLNETSWPFENVLSFPFFVSKPPTDYPTLAKYILKKAPSTSLAEQELVSLLSTSLRSSQQKPCFGIAMIRTEILGILSACNDTQRFVLQVVQSPPRHTHAQEVSYHSGASTIPTLDMDILRAQPIHILRLCEQWPQSTDYLTSIAKDTYAIASMYGYWDMWRVLEGICARFHINPQQLLTS